MSKAFTKEDDSPPEEDVEIEDGPALPAGAKNYITPAGLKRLEDERKQLVRIERPKVVETVAWAAGNGDRSENGDYIYGKKRLREIDRRLRFLTKRIEIAQPVDPAAQKNREQVFFGASVTYAHADGKQHTITIVGIDETDADNGRVSWIAPIAKALLKARIGDTVELRTPGGAEKIEIVDIDYPGEDGKKK